jgi:catechol 2,3-dioxygenase-like lactoylglutathione lyase family enzyme
VEVPVAEPTQPAERMVLGYFIVSDDVERSRRFYTEVLGGTVVFGPEPTNVALANTFIIINGGGGPTDDKPTVTLETPRDPTGSAASSTSGSPTSTPYTPNGAPAARSS